MSETKANRWLKLAHAGLSSANKGNPFWTRADAMRHINAAGRNVQRAVSNTIK